MEFLQEVLAEDNIDQAQTLQQEEMVEGVQEVFHLDQVILMLMDQLDQQTLVAVVEADLTEVRLVVIVLLEGLVVQDMLSYKE